MAHIQIPCGTPVDGVLVAEEVVIAKKDGINGLLLMYDCQILS